MYSYLSGTRLTLPLLLICNLHCASATPAPVSVKLNPRTPDQISAFYEARGFPANMLNILKQQCFVTVFVKNISKNTVWLDLSLWQFRNQDGAIMREHRNTWKKKWQSMNIPMSSQSTFRWTLLPEQADLLPNEHRAGNIILPRGTQSISIKALFKTGNEQSGEPYQLNTNVKCAENK